MKVKAMTFNIRVDVESDRDNAWGYRTEYIGKLMHSIKPHLLGLQEVKPHMLKTVEQLLDNYHWIGEYRAENDEANPLFYDKAFFQLLDHDTFWLSETPERPGSNDWGDLPRICTWGRLQNKENPHKVFLAFNTHLDHISEEARTKGMQLIWTRMKNLIAQFHCPALLMGDFNAAPDSDTIRFADGQLELEGVRVHLQNSYQVLDNSSGESIGCTFHDFSGDTRGEPIDYIFVTQEITLHQSHIHREHFEGNYPSDHYPLVAHITI
ncbi:endonuclease [Pullulanibacillus camelliae]|uniref:Endonuclease n=1 Tax=Pullulanibacillus camelliae TaxID=1707096 RepID=A0A8J2VJW1_9BACL|nr:endonuclease/exonuclease/phosphatase family protein [Pullulanibacillus camelliae]GGE26661.1 endonuclease [Pullulanibacillus camelliae]